MRQFPVFVPVGNAHLGAVITVPDEEPKALVALFPGGGGAPRSHRGAMWRVLAHRLAGRGIASIRVDWRGIGDSTGTVWMDIRQPPIDDAARAVRLAIEATGVDQLGLAGNCFGSRVALGVAPILEETTSMVLVMPKPGTHLKRSRAAQARLAKVKQAVPFLAPPARWALHGLRRLSTRLRSDGASQVVERIAAVSRGARVLVLESPGERRDGQLARAVGSNRMGFEAAELRVLPGEGVRAFDSLERQGYVIEELTEWFDRTLRAEASDVPTGSRSIEASPSAGLG